MLRAPDLAQIGERGGGREIQQRQRPQRLPPAAHLRTDSAPIWLIRTKPSIAETLGSSSRALRRKDGIASAGQAAPTRKNCGRLVASTSSTAVSRWRNTRPSVWPRKLVARMNGKDSVTICQKLPSVEKP